jgi:hypothetical protein
MDDLGDGAQCAALVAGLGAPLHGGLSGCLLRAWPFEKVQHTKIAPVLTLSLPAAIDRA